MWIGSEADNCGYNQSRPVLARTPIPTLSHQILAERVFTLGDVLSFFGLTSKISPLGAMLNFDADVKTRMLCIKSVWSIQTFAVHKHLQVRKILVNHMVRRWGLGLEPHWLKMISDHHYHFKMKTKIQEIL